MKTTTCRSRVWGLLLAGALVAPAPLRAQAQPDSVRTHVVRPGDTLWSLAVAYLGDGHRWREIVQLNSALVREAGSLPVGATLRMPPAGRGARPAAPAPARPAQPAPARADSTVAAQVRAGAPPPRPPVDSTTVRPRADTAMARARVDSASPPRRDSVPATRAEPAAPPARPAPPPDEPGRTVFFGGRLGAPGAARDESEVAQRRIVVGPAGPPASAYESVAAPFIVDRTGIAGAGRCVSLGTGDAAVEGATPGGALLRAPVALVPPSATPAREGSHLVLARLGADLPGLGRVAVPTGLVRVTAGTPVRGTEVVAQFDVMSCSDVVLPALEPSAAAAGPEATPVPTAGPRGQVVWVDGDALLPSLQHVVIVDVGTASGVRVGDVISIYAPGETAVVAVASVLRVDRRSASAQIVRRPQAGIVAGLQARVTGKVP